MVRINGDLIPSTSGTNALGVDMGTSEGSIDISTLMPFSRYHVISGVYHDPLQGQSGVLRYSRAVPAMQVSVDGGLTFANIATTANVVTDIGVLGDTNLTGSVDVASPASGFIVIEDTANASPLLWSVNTLGLSGLWRFPSLGFPTQIPRSFTTTFVTSTSVTVSHNLGSVAVIVQVYDGNSPANFLLPDSIVATDANTVTIGFNRSQSGRVNVIAIL